jgi:hypothetical protein
MKQWRVSLYPDHKNGRREWHIPNPTNYGENFADKWHENENGVPHARPKRSFGGGVAKEDFLNIAEQLDEEHYTRLWHRRSTAARAQSSLNLENFLSASLIGKSLLASRLELFGTVIGQIQVNGFGKDSILESPEQTPRSVVQCQHNVPVPFQVYWQVVNTGKEAEDARQLRARSFYQRLQESVA